MEAVTDAELDVLDVGAGDKHSGQLLFPNSRVVRCDINGNADLTHDIREPFPEDMQAHFDAVVASHILEHVSRLEVLPTLQNLNAVLKPGGIIFVIVPSLEWCAREILKDNPSNALLVCLYGDDGYQAHKSGFTLPFLRTVLGMSGFRVRQAHSEEFTVTMDEKEYVCYQNVVVAFKPMKEDLP